MKVVFLRTCCFKCPRVAIVPFASQNSLVLETLHGHSSKILTIALDIKYLANRNVLQSFRNVFPHDLVGTAMCAYVLSIFGGTSLKASLQNLVICGGQFVATKSHCPAHDECHARGVYKESETL